MFASFRISIFMEFYVTGPGPPSRRVRAPSPIFDAMHDDAFQLEKDTHQRESFPHYEQDRHDAPDIRLGMVQQDVEKTFWMTYNKEADAFDGERLDAWNKSLDVLLIFAGLFSAINTAFILEAYKGLKTDQAELTNKLLTLQLIHRNDGTIFTQDSLSNLVNTEPLATPVNCIYFSSLFCSVTAAFGAVTAKQWLKEYASIGSIMTQADLGRRRQRRYDGMNKWGFSSVMALLPILLQISLILFLVGTVMFLWKVNFPVTFTFLCLFIFIVLVALTFMIIGAVHPWSPFQSLTANASRRLFYKPANIIKSGIQSLAKRLAVAARYPLDATGVVDHHSLHTIIGMQHNHEHAYPPVVPPNSSDVVDTENMNEDLCYQWNGDESEVVSVQSVLWILDQGDHPDTMLVALAMFPKLPRALLLRMLSDPHRAGLLQRIGSFYTSQLHAVPKSRGPDPGLSPASIISGLALHHVLQARSSLYDPKNRREPLFEAFCTTLKTRKPKYDPKGGRIGVVAAILEHAIYHQNGFNRVLQQLCDDDNIGSLRAVLTNPDLDLPVGLPISDRTQASPNVSWMTLHISPFRITLDCIIRDVIHNHRYWDAHKLEKLHTLIEDAWNVDEDKASSFVSCIALAIASLNWAARDKSKLAWNYRSEQEELWLESSLLFNCLALEKRKPDDYFVNVALAVSMFDVAVFQEKKGQMIVQLLPYLLQPKDLDRLVGCQSSSPLGRVLGPGVIRIARSTSIWDTSPEDLPGVVNLLFLCSKAASGSKSSWLSLKHDDYGETISGILSASFQSSATLGAMGELL
ncbi:hypothetical protein FRB99_000864 [Tulasnella sp. 403]|nr:hypothetical protein FRB99_000864 [Tulasnella sp. 403]